WALGFVLGSLLTPALARRIRPAILMSAGLALAAGGYFLLAAVGARGGGGGGGLVLFAVATFVLTFFGSPLFTLTNDVIIGSAPPLRGRRFEELRLQNRSPPPTQGAAEVFLPISYSRGGSVPSRFRTK